MAIPPGTTVIPNIWGILRDPAIYPDPETFRPERHLTSEGALDVQVPNPHDLLFGFGRRICPGRHFANHSVWLAAARLLSCFTLQPPAHATGNKLSLSEQMEWGFVSHVKEFQCNISPRSQAHTALIREAVEEARAG